MIAQRGKGVEARQVEKKPVEKVESSTSAEKVAGKRKLSFKEKHALDTLPATMAKLESEIAALKVKLEDPQLFSRDRVSFDRFSQQLAKLEGDLAASEEQWLELEILRESLD